MESRGNTLAIRCSALRALSHVLKELPASNPARAQVHQRLLALSKHPNTFIRLCSAAALARGGVENLASSEWEALRDLALPFIADPQWMYAEILSCLDAGPYPLYVFTTDFSAGPSNPSLQSPVFKALKG